MLSVRATKIKAERVMNPWTAAVHGDKKSKKSHKGAIQKQRRVLEKRATKQIVKEVMLCEN